ncbi:MAG: hypothetical protein PUB68_04855 [Lachnospiraceae bacterium]|nr:hypothetical protein [uncultured Agathobacter sp.]MBD8926063.1 hypothetical protein [Agathobacter rectalis]MCI7113518.1 hypothetical protein [Lachnobacterium sp.]MDD6138486.1 hypothetical protein [Lachnospiraceae bacterium]MDY6155867.1 hypothetical protein [Agathobacter sp.]MEE1033773.1 hypothetical protein [Agathobacter sp.]
MDEKTLFTPFDEITQTKELQMLKTIVPYLSKDKQRPLVMMISCMAMVNSMKVLSETPALSVAETETPSDRRIAMLNALKKYFSPSEQETIDNILNVFSILDNKEIYDQTGIFK